MLIVSKMKVGVRVINMDIGGGKCGFGRTISDWYINRGPSGPLSCATSVFCMVQVLFFRGLRLCLKLCQGRHIQDMHGILCDRYALNYTIHRQRINRLPRDGGSMSYYLEVLILVHTQEIMIQNMLT